MARTATPHTPPLWSAERYLKLDWPVLALHTPQVGGGCSCDRPGLAEEEKCQHQGKHPRFDKNDLPHGPLSGTLDPEVITAWQQRWPGANLGVQCGERAGIWVLDADGDEGAATLRREIDAHGGDFPKTPRQRTGGGGHQFFFQYVPGLKGEVRFLPGLDVRTQGNLVVVPPSVHKSGRQYHWAKGESPEELPLALAPQWLIAAIHEFMAKQSKPAPVTPGEPIRMGERNQRLFSLAGTLRRKGMSEPGIRVALLEENKERCRPPMEAAEVIEIARKVVANYAPADSGPHNGRSTPVVTRKEEEEETQILLREIEQQKQEWITGEELMARQFPPLRWVVPGMLPEGLALIGGPSKSCKSWMCCELALAVAAGGRLFGQLPVEKGAVLYMALEDSQRRLQDRFRTLLRGEPMPAGLTCATKGLRLRNGLEEQLGLWEEKTTGARLIIIDVLQKVRPPKQPGGADYEQDYTVLEPLHDWADDRHVAVLFAHHTRKALADDPYDMIAGSVALQAVPNTILALMRARGEVDAVLHYTGREVSADALALQWDANSCGWKLLGKARDHRLSRERSEVLDVFERATEDLSPGDIAAVLGKKVSVIQFLLARLVIEGLVRKTSYGKYRLCSGASVQRHLPE